MIICATNRNAIIQIVQPKNERNIIQFILKIYIFFISNEVVSNDVVLENVGICSV